MRKMIGILAAMLLALTVAQAQDTTAAKPRDAIDKMLIAKERALQEAVAKADKAAFLSLALTDAVWTTPQGFVPIALLATGLPHFQLTTWDVVNPHVTWLDENSAVVLYVWTGTGTFDGQPLPATTLASTVWTKRDGKWLAGHHQQTELKK